MVRPLIAFCIAIAAACAVVPYPGAVWITGYWGWSGGHHVWVGGHYEHGRPGYAWQPHQWVHGGDGRWHLEEGHWARR